MQPLLHVICELVERIIRLKADTYPPEGGH